MKTRKNNIKRGEIKKDGGNRDKTQCQINRLWKRDRDRERKRRRDRRKETEGKRQRGVKEGETSQRRVQYSHGERDRKDIKGEDKS